MKNFPRKNRRLQNAQSNFRRNLSGKTRKFLTAVRDFTKNALTTKLPKIIGASKVMSKYASEVTTLLAAKIVQMYRAVKKKAGEIFGKFRYVKTTLAPTILNSRKRFLKIVSQIAHLLKLAFVVSLQVTKVGIMRTIDWTCLLIIKGSNVVRSCLTKSQNLIKSGTRK
ncbi:MAG: hypothetical protein LBK24_01710, partial [Puniceicoccales bacterium]|nr:hypothetical protein [Puniceicoccales bacterium]